MSVSLSDSLLDLNCSAASSESSPDVADDSSAVNEGASDSGGVNVGATGSGANNNNIAGSSNGPTTSGNGNIIYGGSSRLYVPDHHMVIEDDYQEFCEQFQFEVMFFGCTVCPVPFRQSTHLL